jgi:opacity protein-like surface antigen
MRKKILFFLALAISSAAQASESFTLNVPVRFNANQETGEVRVTLGLNASPAGAQLVVNGSTTLNLGDTILVGADSVAFAASTGNSVLITYRPLSNFGADFCIGGGATEKNIPMRFSGAQDVIDFRVNTYVVAAPDVDCTQPSKRTAEAPATLIPVDDGVAPALNATDNGRHPLDVALVLDKSGSMADLPPDAGGGATKDAILKSALQAFIGAWMVIDAPNATGEWSNDRIGVVFFDSSAASQTIGGADPPANFFLRRGDASAWDAVTSSVLSLSPGGSTSIGDGINEAMQQWKADPLNDLTLIVVTDGMQNTAPLVEPASSGFLGLPPVSGLPQELRKRFIPIRTIGFGTPAAVDDALLKNIALETAGVSYIAINGTTMFDTFANTLVSILKGNTASLAMRRKGTMTGAGPTAPESVVVDPSAQRVMFMLQWAPPLRSALDLEVFPPGASVPATPATTRKTAQASIRSFDIEPGDLGTWTVRVKRDDPGHPEPVPYTLNVLFLEQHLDYRLSFDQIRAATGDTIRVRANISYDGKPLASLPADAIRVRIQRPGEALGTILHETRVDVPSGPTTTPSGDIRNPYDSKLAQLGSDLLDRVMPKDVATISLQDQKNGIYTGSFDGTSVPGTYGFEVVLDWTDPRTGHVRREERLEHHVKVKPDLGRTDVTTTRVDSSTVLVRVTPRDKFGNYLGPGYASIIKARLNSEGTLSSGDPIDRDQTGTYEYTVTGMPAGAIPDLDITVDGTGVDNPINSGTASGKWRWFLDLGRNFPHDDSLKHFGGDWSINGGIERRLSNDWSVEGILGYHRFGDVVFNDPHISQLSIGAKRYFGTSPLHPFLDAGLGAYNINIGPNDETRAGAHAGAGAIYEINSHLGVEGVYHFHIINNQDDSLSFSTVQIGVRLAF